MAWQRASCFSSRKVGVPPPQWSWETVAAGGQVGGHQRHLLLQHVEVGVGAAAVVGGDDVAAAEAAHLAAERQVHVDGERAAGGLGALQVPRYCGALKSSFHSGAVG